MAKYLVTGAAGFIGSNIVEYLLDNGETVVGFDNLSTGFEKNLEFAKSHQNKTNFQFIKGDIRHLEECEKACAGVDYVLHLAALGSVPRSMKEPLLYEENNIKGTLNMLVAARDAKAKRFVFSSSSSVYGDTPVLPKVETMTPNPKSPYAISKVTGEYYCSVFNKAYGLPTVILRYFNVFGPRQNPDSQYSAAIPKFIKAFLNNESPVIYGDGEQTRDFTYVENVVNANINACVAQKEALGVPINVGCGGQISLNNLIKEMKVIVGTAVKPIYIDSQPGDIRDSFADIGLAKKYKLINESVLLKIGLDRLLSHLYNHKK